MELLQLIYFNKIAKSDTLTQAARELHVSQPSLSSMLRKMEAELGGKLFVKDGRVLKLNERGQILLRYTEEILSSLQNLRMEMDQLNNRKKAHLAIDLQAASQLMLPVIKTFQAKHKDIQISILQNKQEQKLSASDAGPAVPDIIITADYKQPSRGKVLFKEELVLAVPEKHMLAGRDSVALHELEDERFIFLTQTKRLRQIIDYYCRKAHFTPKISLESDDLGMVKALINSGFGISIIPATSWRGSLHENVIQLRISSCKCIRYIILQITDAGMQNEAAQHFASEAEGIFTNMG